MLSINSGGETAGTSRAHLLLKFIPDQERAHARCATGGVHIAPDYSGQIGTVASGPPKSRRKAKSVCRSLAFRTAIRSEFAGSKSKALNKASHPVRSESVRWQ